jgi:hypothetical protein
MEVQGVSVIIPTIRPAGADRCEAALRKNAGISEDHFEVIRWEDVDRVGCPWMVKCMATWARFQWVMFLGDDTIPQPGIIYNALAATCALPDGWGLVGLNDGIHDGNKLSTHWMGHKNLLPHIGGAFFCTEYTHCFCDMELADRAKALGRFVWAPDARIVHDHPAVRGELFTGDYARIYSAKVRTKDLQTYARRKWKGWR